MFLVGVLFEEFFDEGDVLIADEIRLSGYAKLRPDVGSGQNSLVRNLGSHVGSVDQYLYVPGGQKSERLRVAMGAGSLLVDCSRKESTTYPTYTQLLLLPALRLSQTDPASAYRICTPRHRSVFA